MKMIKLLSLIIILLGSITSVSTWASVRSVSGQGGASETPYVVGGQLSGGSQAYGGQPYASGIKIARRGGRGYSNGWGYRKGGHRHFRGGWGYRGSQRHFRRGWGYRSGHRHFRRGGRGFYGRGFYGRGFYGRGFGGYPFRPGIGYGVPYYPNYYYGW